MQLDSFPSQEEFTTLAAQCNLIPCCRTLLADSETPVSLLRKLYSESRTIFLFESADGGEKFGRYSYIGLGAKKTITVTGTEVIVTGRKTTEHLPHNGHPLQQLKAIAERYTPAKLSQLQGFSSGMVGWFSYETVSFFENRVPYPLAPEETAALFIIPEQLLIFDNRAHSVTLASLCFLDDESDPAARFTTAQNELDSLQKAIEAPHAAELATPASTDFQGLTSVEERSLYGDIVTQIKEHIRDGEMIQAVVARTFTTPLTFHPIDLYRAQRYINPSPYLFFYQAEGTIITGSSPETLVKVTDREAVVRPIAGTRPRGKTEAEDQALAEEMLSDEKERAEHLMLVDLGRNDLGRIAATGTVTVTDLMFVERYSHVMHLVSNITCQMKPECDQWDVFAATFPAGTLSGAPKVRAMEYIAKYENSPRGPYGGAIGYVDFAGNMDFAITIRSAVIKDGLVTVKSGAGLVAGSDPEMETKETENKAAAMARALEMIH